MVERLCMVLSTVGTQVEAQPSCHTSSTTTTPDRVRTSAFNNTFDKSINQSTNQAIDFYLYKRS